VELKFKRGDWGYTPSTVSIRCEPCQVGFSAPTEDWEPGVGSYSIREEAEAKVLAKWNRRSVQPAGDDRDYHADATLESIQGAVNEFLEKSRELRRNDVPDIYLMTNEAKRILEERSNSDDTSPPIRFDGSYVCGISFESYPTLQDCHVRAKQLFLHGKKVAVIY